MHRRRAIRALFGGAASCTKALLASSEVSADERDYTIHSEVRLVLLDISVTDSRGSIVSGLPKESFQVREDGRLQSITVFEDGDIPVTVGLVVDESRSMTTKRTDVLAAAETFIQASNPKDEIFVLNFNDKVRRGLPEGILFSDDPRQLRAALDMGRAQGKTALNDAIVAGLDQLELGRRAKKALVVVSDGGDNASQHARGEMLERVEASIATIYTIGLFDEEDPDRNPAILKRLAVISGGETYFPRDAAGTIPVCRKIAKDIRSRYTVGYVPRPENGNGLRHVHVLVSAAGRTGLRARTRTTYRY